MVDILADMGDISCKEDIKLLVHTFYEQVATDPVIGTYFTETAAVDWNHHLPKMIEFWSLLILGEGQYSGNTTQTHVELHEKRRISAKEFDHWVSLFHQTVNRLFSGEKAELAKQKAVQLSLIMQVKIY